MSTNKLTFGLPLDAPIKQTILPIVSNPTGIIYGYYIIAATTFDGSERTQPMLPTPVPITTVSLPTYGRIHGGKALIGGLTGSPVQQYMAAVYSDDELVSCEPGRAVVSAPWLAYDNFVSVADAGYSQQFSHALYTFKDRLTLGNLIQSLVYGMAAVNSPVADQVPPPTASNAVFSWYTNINEAALLTECPYFDFNWVGLFQASSEQTGTLATPITITNVEIPAGFKVFTVAHPTVIAGSDVTFDTLRVLITNADLISKTDPSVFKFMVETNNGGVPVELTLTVVGITES